MVGGRRGEVPSHPVRVILDMMSEAWLSFGREVRKAGHVSTLSPQGPQSIMGVGRAWETLDKSVVS